mmetsp:Transcript_17194/g.37563  ORF Transcript_17194/g.37563 Transcript_17194/m.37563 type:complete len:380 (+) Transcript_17194:243-1382(+)
MPPKEQTPSKKAVKAKKEKMIDESTFGLKNKNKSAKVQQFVNRVQKSVKNQSGGADSDKAKEMKKQAKHLQEEELRLLLNAGISGQFGKKKSALAAQAASLGVGEASDEVAQLLEDMSSDEDDDEYAMGGGGGGTAYVEVDEPVAVQVFREKTIEDIIEEQRERLAALGLKGTPITEETFTKWRAAKLARRQYEAEVRLKQEQSKKKGGKGLSVLSGKELFNFNKDLFVDDDGAMDAAEERTFNAETELRRVKEEAQAEAEAQRIRAEQERLSELQRVEFEVRLSKEVDRRVAAAAKGRATFMMGEVQINQVVFEDDEEEDLALYPEEQLFEAEVREAVVITPMDVEEEEMDCVEEGEEGEEEEGEEEKVGGWRRMEGG